MLIEAGKESDYKKEELTSLDVTRSIYGEISRFPLISDDKCVVCAYNQWGMAGRARMIVCQDLADMNQLSKSFDKGGALQITWYSVSRARLDKFLGETQSKDAPSFSCCVQ